MKILILIPVWKRPEILRLCINNLINTLPDYAQVIPLFILSPEDPELKVIEKLIKGFERVYYSNEYLSDKLNFGMSQALKYEFDYLMGLGSDNIFTSELWELYRDKTELFFSINDFYVWDVKGNRAGFFRKYVEEKELGGIGAGRMIHYSILEDDPCIYRPRTNCGMDGFSAWHLYKLGYLQKIIPANKPVMLDIKTATNINQPVEIWQDRESDVPVQWLRMEFGLLDDIDRDFDLLDWDAFYANVCKLSQQMTMREAFEIVNYRYEMAYGEQRFKNVESYKTIVTRRYKK